MSDVLEEALAYWAQGEELEKAAEHLIRRVLGDEGFDRVIEAMVRSDFGPELLGQGSFDAPEPVATGIDQVRGRLGDLGSEEMGLVQRITRAAHAGSDPARALFRVGTQSAYWAIPESLLGLPDEQTARTSSRTTSSCAGTSRITSTMRSPPSC
ncbi:MAG: hypothetical protein A2Z32_10660 [Chloroflexi bacterium RBG_16_69_14]|nr:MAG: hypothetical protein A2Z32_10660 [Chloroflexi bacterium RBG_16_69_14]